MIQCKTSKEIGGMGHSMKRKEDARFIEGQGNYIDDIKLDGISLPSTCTAKIVQDLADFPSIRTVQAPQLEVSHPM